MRILSNPTHLNKIQKTNLSTSKTVEIATLSSQASALSSLHLSPTSPSPLISPRTISKQPHLPSSYTPPPHSPSPLTPIRSRIRPISETSLLVPASRPGVNLRARGDRLRELHVQLDARPMYISWGTFRGIAQIPRILLRGVKSLGDRDLHMYK